MIRAGIIALGWAGKTHLKYLKGCDDVEIVGLCDPDAAVLDEAVKEFGGRGFSDWKTMIDGVSPDAVWLCTPSTIRLEPLVCCADRGIPVFCEKPAELRGAVAEKIAVELEQRDARVQVGYVFRSMPIAREARKAIADDRIHAIQSLYSCPACLTREIAPWFFEHEKSGGPLIDQATHNIDLLRFLFGEIVEVTGLAGNPVKKKEPGYTVDEVFSLSLRFDCGTLCSHVHSWVGDVWRNDIVFIGEKRVYHLDLWEGRLAVKEGKETRDFSQDQDHLYDHENRVFIDQVKSGDWSGNPSTYGDALKSLKTTLHCDEVAKRAFQENS
jgi:predicted dehydrogenase